jgi:hypothetical protein
MIDEVPNKAQLIIAAEDQFGLRDDEVDIVDVGGQKDHVLRLDQFVTVSDALRPYLGLLV